jgi:hypothetical protein
MQADGIDFLNTLISLCGPHDVIHARIRHVAKQTGHGELARWVVTKAMTPEVALLSLFEIVESFEAKDARDIAALCRETLPGASGSLVHIFKFGGFSLSQKIAVICVIAGAPFDAITEILKLPDLPSDIRRILAMGTSAHGRLQVMRREPDLAKMITRSALSYRYPQ